jgi:hypothetical protein
VGSEPARGAWDILMTLLNLLFRPARAYSELGTSNQGLFQAVLSVACFSATNICYVFLFSEPPPIQAGFDWAWKIGVVIGIFVALAAAFLLWLYFGVGIFLILSLFDTVPYFAPIFRVVGLSFFFLFLGRSLTIALQLVGLSSPAAAWIYSAFLILTLLAMAYGLKSVLRIPATDAGIAVVVPMIVIELLSLWLFT